MANLRNLTISALLPATQYTTNTNGDIIDLINSINPAGRQARAMLNCGAFSSGTGDCVVYESASSTMGSAVAIATFTQVTTTGSETISVPITKRYVRLTATVSGQQDMGAVLLTENQLT